MEPEPVSPAAPSGPSRTADVFEMVVHHSLDGVIVGRPDGETLYANAAACEMFRATEQELRRLGRGGLTDPAHPVWKAMVEERRRAGQVTGVAPMIRPDGTSFVAAVASAIFDTPDGERTCVTLRDVTAQVRQERILAGYNEVVEALLAGAEAASVLEVVARHARIVFDATDATVVTAAPPPDDVMVVAADGPAAGELLGRRYPAGTLARRVMDRPEPVLIEDMMTSALSGPGRRTGRGSAMVAPVVSGEQAYGVLFVGVAAEGRRYGREDLELVAQFARRAALTLDLGEARASSERQQRRLNEQLQTALRSRIIIEQAKGVISANRQVSPQEAFERLRAYARSHNRDVHSTARAVMEGKLLI